jgi:spore coat polysaccharide biosynthesis protein SpsF
MSSTVGIIQARTGSKRLPNKVILEVNGQPIIKWQIERIKKTKNIDVLVLATSTENRDEPLASIAKECGIEVFKGSASDVLSRFYGVIEQFNPKTIVRFTGDCPLYMPDLGSSMLEEYRNHTFDYFSNTLEPTWPDGCDIEIVAASSLVNLREFELNDAEKEHVTLGIYKRNQIFNCWNFANKIDESSHRWTLDNEDDFRFISSVYACFKDRETEFSYNDVMNLFVEGVVEPRFDLGGMRNSALSGL